MKMLKKLIDPSQLPSNGTPSNQEEMSRVAEMGDIEAKIEKIENNRNDDRERFLQFALAFADDLGNGSFALQPNQAKKCELLLFPNGFFVDADKKVHIPKISPFYRYRSTKKASKDAQNSLMVNLVQSNWNILLEDFYRVMGIINVLYPTNYIPGFSRTNEYNPKHQQPGR